MVLNKCMIRLSQCTLVSDLGFGVIYVIKHDTSHSATFHLGHMFIVLLCFLFAEHTRHLHVAPLSGQCILRLTFKRLVGRVGITCGVIWLPSTLPPSWIRSLIKPSLQVSMCQFCSTRGEENVTVQHCEVSKVEEQFLSPLPCHSADGVYVMRLLLSTHHMRWL